MLHSVNDIFAQYFNDSENTMPYCVYEPYINEFVNPKMIVEKCVVGKSAAIAYQLEKFDSIGIECVARCVNKIIAKGAAVPASFDVELPDAFAEQLIPGFVKGCIQGCCSLEVRTSSGCSIVGMATGILDLHEERGVIKSGDRLIGLLSSGFHDESLVKVANILKLSQDNIGEIIPEIFCKMEDELFRPAKIYARPVMHVARTLGIKLNGICYLGENGFIDSIYDMLPEGITARILPEDFPMSGLYELIAKRGGLSTEEMFNNFNMGICLVMAVDKKIAGDVMSALIQIGEHPYVIGCCVDGERAVELKW